MNENRQTTKKICISIDRELLDWIDAQVRERRFATRSHGIALAVQELGRKEQGSA
jgi:Arc/MetJ-type ribon-helix-helix transcriptional regulator